MRISILAIALISAGCAGAPTAPPTPNPPAATYVAMASTPAVKIASATSGGPIDPKLLTDAKKLGYKVVNQNDQEIFCTEDIQTGSHVHRETVCMTADEMTRLRDQNRLQLNNILHQTQGPGSH